MCAKDLAQLITLAFAVASPRRPLVGFADLSTSGTTPCRHPRPSSTARSLTLVLEVHARVPAKESACLKSIWALFPPLGARKMWFLPRNGHGDAPAACYVGAGPIKSIQAAPHVHGAHFYKHIEPVKVKVASSAARCAFGPAESGTRSRRKIQRRCSILNFCGFLFFLEV